MFLYVEGIWIRSGYLSAAVQWFDTGQELAIFIIYHSGYLNMYSICWH